jgi:hypothetical protein
MSGVALPGLGPLAWIDVVLIGWFIRGILWTAQRSVVARSKAMSDALTEVLERASMDAAFRAQLQSDPQGALVGYELTGEERAALLARDADQLEELGVDVRITKQIAPPTTDTPWPDSPSVS